MFQYVHILVFKWQLMHNTHVSYTNVLLHLQLQFNHEHNYETLTYISFEGITRCIMESPHVGEITSMATVADESHVEEHGGEEVTW